jgi:uncharacterized OB-fold protein
LNHLDTPLLPVGPIRQYEEHLRRGEFLIQRCAECARHVFYPRVACPHCGGPRLDWVRPAGGGEVHAVTVVARSADKGGPYNVVLVDLDEGVRLMSRVDGVPPESVRIGLRVVAACVPHGDTHQVVFRPEAAR